MGKLTFERLRQVLRYNSRTGEFRWRILMGSQAPVGRIAGSLHTHGYIHVKIDRNIYAGHRLAWLYKTGTWPANDVEHKNRNKADNRWTNLRLANDSQNQANTVARRDNTSGFKSVHLRKANGKWRARIQVRKQRYSLGDFITPEEAHAAYVQAAKKHFGEFARAR